MVPRSYSSGVDVRIEVSESNLGGRPPLLPRRYDGDQPGGRFGSADDANLSRGGPSLSGDLAPAELLGAPGRSSRMVAAADCDPR